jgi:hypothetical protein
MELYTRCVVEDACYDREPAECANHGPECAKDVTDIMLLRLSVSQESRNRSRQFVKW